MGRGATTYKVQLLDATEHSCELGGRAKGCQLMDKVCESLGVEEKDYFGLRFIDPKDGQYNWIDPLKSLKKQLKGAPPHLYFAVKFYPPNPTTLAEDITRYLFVLQIREDLLKGKLQCSVPIHALLGSYVVQGELGDYEECSSGNYLEDFKFCPNQGKELLDKVVEFHKKHHGMTPSEAEVHYLDTVRKFPHYGMDMHPAMDAEGEPVQIAVSSAGIHVFQNTRQINKFVWPKILTISFKLRKYYMKIKPADEDEKSVSVGILMPSRRAAKRLWKVSLEHHTFFRLVSSEIPKKPEIIRLGSKFRYSGRTHHQARHNENIWLKTPTTFDRVPSKRFSQRVLDSNREWEDEKQAEEKKDEEKPVEKEKTAEEVPAPAVAVAVETAPEPEPEKPAEPEPEKPAEPEPEKPAEPESEPPAEPASEPPADLELESVDKHITTVSTDYEVSGNVIIIQKQETVVTTTSTVTESATEGTDVVESHTTTTVNTVRQVSEEVASGTIPDETPTAEE